MDRVRFFGISGPIGFSHLVAVATAGRDVRWRIEQGPSACAGDCAGNRARGALADIAVAADWQRESIAGNTLRGDLKRPAHVLRQTYVDTRLRRKRGCLPRLVRGVAALDAMCGSQPL